MALYTEKGTRKKEKKESDHNKTHMGKSDVSRMQKRLSTMTSAVVLFDIENCPRFNQVLSTENRVKQDKKYFRSSLKYFRSSL